MSRDADQSPFKRGTLIALVVVGGVSLAATLVAAPVATDLDDRTSVDTTSWSRSALGYHALVALLEDSGVPVVVSRSDSPGKLDAGSVLLLAEPPAGEDEGEGLRSMLRRAADRGAHVVVVLPKWHGRPATFKPGWVEDVALRPRVEALDVLVDCLGADVALDPRLLREGAAVTDAVGLLPAPELIYPVVIDAAAADLEPLLGQPDAALVARHRELPITIVADPDLLNTAGLVRGDNALVAQRLFAEVLTAKNVVVDETLHGFGREESIWAELARPPLVFITVQILLILALVVWAATGRFGKPRPPEERLAPGKGALVDNTADLLVVGGHLGDTLRHYERLTLRAAARECALPAGLGDKELEARLNALSAQRGVSIDRAAIRHRMGQLGRGEVARIERPRRMLALARALYRWKKEVVHGPARDQ